MQKINVWKDYRVTWNFETDVFGSFPASEDVMGAFINKKMKDRKITPTKISLMENGVVEVRREGMSLDDLYAEKIQEGMASLPTEEGMIEERTLVFRRHEGKLAFQGGTVRAHIKDISRVLSSLVLTRVDGGPKSLNVRATNGLYVAEEWVYLQKDGRSLTEPEFKEQFFVHVTNPRTGAPMSSIKECEGVRAKGASLSFTLKVLGGIVTDEELDAIFTYGGIHGYGQERSRGMGKYLFTIEPVESTVRVGKKQKKSEQELHA